MKNFLNFIICGLGALLIYNHSYGQDSIYDKYNNAHKGLYAKDFSFITSEDTVKQRLYHLKADTIILFFYDPDCYHCKKEIKKL